MSFYTPDQIAQQWDDAGAEAAIAALGGVATGQTSEYSLDQIAKQWDDAGFPTVIAAFAARSVS